MHLNDLLVAEFDDEAKKTRETLARVPAGKEEYRPHAKSMPLGRLAPHIAQLTGFGVVVLTTPSLDFATANFKPLTFESAEQLVRVFDEGCAQTRAALKNMPDEGWDQPWTLSAGGKTIFTGSRFLAYRAMFLNHIVHHRAQLGVYLRLNEATVPATYGPSADEPMGF
jgi:uncharacterized damage-inducible protein DinB